MNKFVLLITTIFLLFSCSKEEDPIPPTIQMSSPTYLEQFNAIDTVQLTGQVNDDKAIERISITLKDASNGSSVLNSIVLYPTGKSYAIDMPFYLDDINLPSGNYYFEIRANDEVNSTKSYIDVLINGAPKQRLGVVIADEAGGNNNIHFLDNGFNASLFNSYSGNYRAMAVDAFNQNIILAPNSLGDLQSIDLLSGSTNWNSNLTWDITSFYFSGDYTYVGMVDGSIKRYNSNGLSNFHGNSNPNFHVEYITQHENYLVMEEQMVSGSTVILALRWVPSGVTAQQLTVNEDILGVYSLNSNELVLLTNNSSQQGNLLFYDISIGQTSNPFAINTAKIDACVEISNGIYIVAENNQLTQLDANGFSKGTYLTATGANDLYYDAYTNELIVVDGNLLSIYDFSSKTLKGSYTHSSAITGVTFWYNKE